MEDYLFYTENTFMHYFYKSGSGLCMRHNTGRTATLYHDCSGIYSVIKKNNNTYEILCLNSKNELVFLLPASGKQHTITHTGEDIKLTSLRLFELSGKTHFIYSARYRNELILVYSPIDNNAMPKTLAKLQNPYFCMYNSAVYFTLQGGAIGYIDLSRRDFTFNRLTTNADSVQVFSHNGSELIVYKKGDELYFQNRPVCRDKYAEMPIIFTDMDSLFLMWRSRGFILYKKSSDAGRTWGSVGRILTPERETVLAIVNDGNTSHMRYIEKTGSKPRLLGSAPKNGALPAAPDTKLAAMQSIIKSQSMELERIKKELHDLKSQMQL